MTESLVVLLRDAQAGILTRLQGGRLRFDYDATYRSRPHATPLSVSMPIQIRSHSDQAINPWLWNLLPDNDAVLARWARQFQASVTSPFSLLATPVGRDCAGAVRFIPQDILDQEIDRPGSITWLTNGEIAERLRELQTDSTAWLGNSFTGQFSLSGAQAKTALLHVDGRWGVPHGSVATTHILKPAVAGLDDHDLNEHLCLDAARRAGLLAARTRVSRFDDQTAIVVERYDREHVKDTIIRIHQEDLCQALGLPPTKKYQNEGGPGPTRIAELFRKIMPPGDAEAAVMGFFDALVWNWLIGGTDAHAKNYSILLSGDQVRLAPLYDIASALPYGTDERKLRFAMKIGGDYRVFTYYNTWIKAAQGMDIDPDWAINRVRKLNSLVADAFAQAANEPDITVLGRDLPGRLVDIIAERARRCKRLLDPGR
jgi:serine/threonine-protein kinase HipA